MASALHHRIDVLSLERDELRAMLAEREATVGMAQRRVEEVLQEQREDEKSFLAQERECETLKRSVADLAKRLDAKTARQTHNERQIKALLSQVSDLETKLGVQQPLRQQAGFAPADPVKGQRSTAPSVPVPAHVLSDEVSALFQALDGGIRTMDEQKASLLAKCRGLESQLGTTPSQAGTSRGGTVPVVSADAPQEGPSSTAPQKAAVQVPSTATHRRTVSRQDAMLGLVDVYLNSDFQERYEVITALRAAHLKHSGGEHSGSSSIPVAMVDFIRELELQRGQQSYLLRDIDLPLVWALLVDYKEDVWGEQDDEGEDLAEEGD